MSSTSQVTTYSDPCTTSDLGWAAGIVDGEGCISMQRIKRRDGYGSGVSFDLRLDVANTDHRMMAKLQQLFGGNVSKHLDSRGNRMKSWRWIVHGEKAAEVLRKIRPYLVIKTEQADVALSSRQFIRCDRRADSYKATQLADHAQKLKDLKKYRPEPMVAQCL